MRSFSWIWICPIAFLLCGAAMGQVMPGALRVHFDQPVTAGTAQLSPGDYAIRELHSTGGNVVLTIGAENGTQTVLLVNPIRTVDGGKAGAVVLGKRGTQYVLDKIWITPDTGFEVMQ